MRKIKLFVMLGPFLAMAQNNLVDSSNWTIDDGATTGFNIQGEINENVREMGTGPHGTSVILWKSVPNGSGGYDGGWKTSYLPAIDHTKKYRFSIWLKQTNSTVGNVNFGFYANDNNENYASLRLDNSVVNNAYFYVGDLPQMDEWYLLVGIVHGSSDSSTTNEGRIYDVYGNAVQTITDFKFTSDASFIRHRSFFYEANTNDRLYHYAPTVYEVNGQEPSIQELINGPGGTDNQSPTAPILSNTDQSDITADLSWGGATDNVGVTGYKVYKDGNLEATLGNVSTYQVTGLTASTTYSFTIRAVDAAANESPLSNTVSVTTDTGSGGGGGTGDPVWTESGSVVSYTGDVAIGTSTVPSGYKLAVEGKIRTREIRVDQDNWPDYVFENTYRPMSLEELQKHIKEKGHLPNIPSAKEVRANGVELGEMDRLLLEKIEELTLYIIELKKEMEELKRKNQ